MAQLTKGLCKWGHYNGLVHTLVVWPVSYVNTLLYMYKKNYDTTIPFLNKDSSVIGKDSETR
jgi:hypothetical protein